MRHGAIFKECWIYISTITYLNSLVMVPESIFNQKDEPQRHLADSMQNVMNELRSDVMEDQTGWQSDELRDMGLQTLRLAYEEPEFSCLPGSVIKNKDCGEYKIESFSIMCACYFKLSGLS